MTPKVSSGLAANCHTAPERKEWLRRLPDTLHNLTEQWSLELGDPFESELAWVAPVRLPEGDSAVLKIGMPHMEGRDELAGMIFWNGDPTAKVFRSDERLNAMLLERCEPGTSLRAEPQKQQDVVIAGLLRKLWRTPPQHPFRSLAEMTQYWAEQTLSAVERWADAHLVREGLSLLSHLPETSPRNVLLATDLHAGNVLRATRLPWLVIDPKPFIGDPAYDVTQHLFNCPERMLSTPHETIRRMADLLEVDSERVRLWMFARAAAEPRDDFHRVSFALARSLAP